MNIEEIQRMLGFDSTNFTKNNSFPLVEETPIQKFVDDALNKTILEKEVEIQNLKKKLKLPHDSHVETAELNLLF